MDSSVLPGINQLLCINSSVGRATVSKIFLTLNNISAFESDFGLTDRKLEINFALKTMH
jgi:hypothetical protein